MADKHTFSVFKLAGSIETCRDKLLAKGFSQVATNDPSVCLFTRRTKDLIPKGLRALSAVAADPNWHPPTETRVSAAAIFQTGKSHYVVTVGQVFPIIRDLLEPLFGIDVACRIVEPGTIATTGSTVFIGPVEHEDKTYRQGYDPRGDWSTVSRLFNRMIAKLDLEKVKFDLEIQGSKRGEVRVHGSQGFRVSHSMDVEGLKTMVTHLDDVLARAPKVPMLSGATEVTLNNAKSLLWDELARNISAELKNYARGRVDWNRLPLLSHQDPQFLSCDEYTISYRRKTSPPHEDLTWDVVLRFFCEQHLEPSSATLGKVEIGCWLEGEEVVRDSLRNFIQTDLTMSGKWYFLAHGRWYEHGQEFEDNMYTFLGQFIEVTSPLPPRNLQDKEEDDYLARAISAVPGLMLMHKKLVRGRMELCDLVYAPDDTTEPTLIYVKRGTGQSVRDLAAQALESTVRFQQDNEFRERAIEKVQEALPRERTVRLEPGHFRVAIAVLGEQEADSGGLGLKSLSVVARLNLCAAIQAIRATGISSVRIWLIPLAAKAA